MSLDKRIQSAQIVEAESLWSFIRDPHPEVILSATLNRHLTEEMAVFIAKKSTTPAEALGFLASDVRFRGSYKLKLAICKNPKCPPRVSLSLLKFLRIFDLSDIARSKHLPTVLRQKIELSILERIPSMPSGVKIALARRANSTIIMALMEKGDKLVIETCLNSPGLTEGDMYKLINKPSTKPQIISMIAKHQKWSLRYAIKFGLIRNFYTPMSYVTAFIKDMKTNDLKDLYSDAKVPSSTKPFIYRELMDREAGVEHEREVIYDISEDDDSGITETEA